MSAINEQEVFIKDWQAKLVALIYDRNNLSKEELDYVVTKIEAMRDKKLKAHLTNLIGWGDAERAEVETFVTMSIELMKIVKPSQLRQALRNTELKTLLRKTK